MIAGRADATGGRPDRDAQGTRRHFLEWLEGGQDLLTRVSALCDDLDESRGAVEGAHEECARLRQDMVRLRQDNDELRAGNARLADELARHRTDAASLEAEVQAIRVQNAALMDERGATAKLIADKLEDMLAQVLPRLAARAPAAAHEAREPAARAETVAPAAAEPAPAPSIARAPAPVAAAEPEVAGDGGVLDLSEPPEAVADAGEPTCVMVVDDEPDFTALLADHLGSAGYSVIAALSGEDAVSKLDTFAPRLVLLDMMMAGIGGMETLRRIKAARPETAVIMITALADRDIARKALAAGASDYLTKPLSLDLLDSAVAVHAGGHPSGLEPATSMDEVELITVAPATARRAFFART